MGEILHGDDIQSQPQSLERLLAIEEELRQQRSRDSICTDVLSNYTTFFESSPIRIDLPDNDLSFFNDLFTDMDSSLTRGETVRILHYGDSQIEADRITNYIRQYLQDRFGGNGPGLLPVAPLLSFSMKQTISESIEGFIVDGTLQNKATHNRYGLMGHFGYINGTGSVSIRARKEKDVYEGVRKFHNIQLFVGREAGFYAQMTVNEKTQLKADITKVSPITVYSWSLEEPIVRFSLYMGGRGELYGLAVDGTAGVAVDNIPFRGSGGTFFTSLEQSVVKAMFKQLNVRLILLEFGGNSVPHISSAKSVTDYSNSMLKQIIYLQSICPEAKILVIGVADMSTKVKGQLTTYPYLELLNETMKETALQAGAAFWNMYEAMGGKNSMIEWVNHSPALATSDYVHFTMQGCERIASLFCETLMVYYDYYKFITNNEGLICEKPQSQD
ncbi:MAG: hypothetical protein FWF67_05755 [Fibromonadales bacterium]|nr:hypothetical protein [Fibromonadales bacterium]